MFARWKKELRPLCRHRDAFTLVEVLLVLALLVVVGAVTAPIMAGSVDRARLTHSGDLLRAAWSKARLSAMQAGESYAFRFEPKGSRYQIARVSAISAAGATDVNSLPAEPTSGEEYSDADILRLSRDRLPEGVIFDSAQLESDAQQGASMPSTSDWSAPILFYADGTTADAVLLLANSHGLALRVTLRGLTGISSVGQVAKGTSP
jgi:prepilin-type N-terminal cleavage/methylation domain-containing protein